MIENYALSWKNKPCGVIIYDTTTNKLSAELLHPENGYPAALFGFNASRRMCDDRAVREFISGRVAPPTRENIEDVLKILGLQKYDEWGIYKALGGKTTKDYCSIHLVDADVPINQN